MKHLNFGMTQDEFVLMIHHLKQGDNDLYEKMFLSKFNESIQLLKRKFRAQHDDAYDSTMDATLAFRKRLIDDKVSYGNINFLFNKIVSQHYQKKMGKFKTTELEEIHLPEEIKVMDEDDIMMMRKTWSELGASCKDLLFRNLYGGMKLVDIANQENRTSSSVRKAKRRCMNKLLVLYSKNSKTEIHGTFSPII